MTRTAAPSALPRQRRHRPPAKRHSRGQAIIWLLGTLAASAAVMYGVYNVGMLTSAKAKTVNAADAAALAGATTQARLLNLMAYNNRAMIANEVFLIQMLSMESWLGYFQTTARNISRVLNVAGLAVPPLQAGARVLRATSDTAREGQAALRGINRGLIAGLETAKLGYGVAHGVARLIGAALAEDNATRVIGDSRTVRNGRVDAGLLKDDGLLGGATQLENNRAWFQFTRQYRAGERRDSRQVLLNSRDEFSTDRPGQGWLNMGVPCVAGLEKRGGARLAGFDRWETQDTLELWTNRRLCSKRWTPIGWGRANADWTGTPGAVWAPWRGAQRLAWNAGPTGGSRRGWSGVPSTFDVRDTSTASRADLGVDFVVAVQRPRANTLTTSTLGAGVDHDSVLGASNMDELLANDKLAAVSKARVHFERPLRGLSNDFTATGLWRPDSAKEYGSLFSPYWQARLTDFGTSEKAVIFGAQGINPLLAPTTPGGQR